jgi:retinol-binding protein 3
VRVDSRVRRAVIADLVRQLHRRYVFPDSVARIEALLNERRRSGAYDHSDTGPAFGALLTEDLRRFDLHFDVRVDPQLERTLRAAGSDTAAVLPELPLSADSLAALRRDNFGFRSLRLLPGNVAWLELNALADARHAMPTARAAMEFLRYADAAILDLREVRGGYGNMVQFLTSTFFAPDSVALLSSEDRERGTTLRAWTRPSLAPIPLRHVELFILTSGNTGSAGEALAFALQVAGRATLMGERTVGAAHAGGWVPLGRGFVAFVPNARSFDPRTGRDWERIGVEPTLAVPAARALDAAHAEAVRRLAARSSDPRRTGELAWLLPLLERRAAGALAVPPAILLQQAGEYERCSIRLEGREFRFVGVSGVAQPLIALTEDTYLIEDDRFAPEKQVRVRFVAGPDGRITSLQLLVDDGRVLTRKRIH